MLTSNEIKVLVRNGEGFNVEFKRSVPAKVRELTEEVCGFANSAGGYVLIGVADDGDIVGLSMDNAKRSAIQVSVGAVSPTLAYEMYSVEVDGREVWVIEVPAGRYKPYLLSGAIFVRKGANCQKLVNADEIRDMFQRNERIYFDAMPVPKVDLMRELDREAFDEFRYAAGISDKVPAGQVLENLQVFDEDNVVKSGGVLFFARHPEDIFFHAVVRCVLFKGTEKVYILDDKTFSGPLPQQYGKAIEWLQSKLLVSYRMEGTGPREELWEIPLEVFKEAIVNALAHRDYYEQGASVTIEMFDDRVEISNPGTLLPVVAKNFGRRSLSRNPLIFGLFTRMRLVEHIGSGIPRMKKLMLDAGLPEPEYDLDGMFTITLRRPGFGTLVLDDPGGRSATDLTPAQDRILKCMIDNPAVSIDTLVGLTGLGRTTLSKRIKELKDMGLVSRSGRKYDGRWVVKSGKQS